MKLTIITINFNNAPVLRETLESVLSQISRDFEYLVIDGGSTDNSVDIIREFESLFNSSFSGIVPFIWISEPDNGIYHAMNKGIRMAKGEYLHFLNSGDWLVGNRVVENMLNEISLLSSKEKPQIQKPDILIGNVISVRPDGKIRHNKNRKEISLFTFYRGTIQHTSAYIRRSLFDKYGLYDESLKIAADWKWYLIVAVLNKVDVQFTDTYVTCFDTTGISSTNLELDKAERRKVLEELLPPPILADYDKYHFDILQMERIKKHPVLYRIFWFVERCLFKIEKWRIKYCGWRTVKYKSH